jgi:WD40 repeat protein
MAFSPDGSQLVIVAGAGAGAELWSWQESPPRRIGHLPVGSYQQAAFHPERHYIALGSLEGTVSLWDGQATAPVSSLQHDAPLHGLAFSPDGLTLASLDIDGRLYLWSVPSVATEVSGVERPRRVFAPWSDEPVAALAYLPQAGVGEDPEHSDAGLVAVATRTRVELFDPVNAVPLRLPIVAPEPILGLCGVAGREGPPQLVLATGSRLVCWEERPRGAGRLDLAATTGPTAALTPGRRGDRQLDRTGSRLLLRHEEASGARLDLVDVASGRTRVVVPKLDANAVWSLDPAHPRLAVADSHGGLRVLDTGTAQVVAERPLAPLLGPSDPPTLLQYAPGGETLLLATRTSRHLIWRSDLAGPPLRDGVGSPVVAAEAGVAFVSGVAPETPVAVVDLISGKEIGHLPATDRLAIESGRYDFRARVLALMDDSAGRVQIDTMGGTHPRQILDLGGQFAQAVALAPDAGRVAVALEGGEVHQWNLPQAEPSGTRIVTLGNVVRLGYLSDGRVLAGVYERGLMVAWEAGTGRELSFRARYSGDPSQVLWSADRSVLLAIEEPVFERATTQQARLWRFRRPNRKADEVELWGRRLRATTGLAPDAKTGRLEWTSDGDPPAAASR